MQYLKGYETNPQIRILHNVKAIQSLKGWTQAEVFKAIADAKAGIAYEFCETCKGWIPLDCKTDHAWIPLHRVGKERRRLKSDDRSRQLPHSSTTIVPCP